jgi:hypothetical protein
VFRPALRHGQKVPTYMCRLRNTSTHEARYTLASAGSRLASNALAFWLRGGCMHVPSQLVCYCSRYSRRDRGQTTRRSRTQNQRMPRGRVGGRGSVAHVRAGRE